MILIALRGAKLQSHKRMRSIPETCQIWGPRKVRRLFGERRNGGASESPHKTSSASAGAKDAQPVTTTPRLPRFHTVARRYFTASAFARSDFIAPKALRSPHFFTLHSYFFTKKSPPIPGDERKVFKDERKVFSLPAAFRRRWWL